MPFCYIGNGNAGGGLGWNFCMNLGMSGSAVIYNSASVASLVAIPSLLTPRLHCISPLLRIAARAAHYVLVYSRRHFQEQFVIDMCCRTCLICSTLPWTRSVFSPQNPVSSLFALVPRTLYRRVLPCWSDEHRLAARFASNGRS